MRSDQMTRYILWATVCGLLLAGGAWAGDAVKPNAVQSRTMDDIEKNGTGIVGLAYPTAKASLKTEYVKGTAYKDGSFDLTYKFTYKDSDGKTQDFTLKFVMAAKGELDDMKVIDSSEIWPPFGTLALLGVAVDELAKEMQKK